MVGSAEVIRMTNVGSTRALNGWIQIVGEGVSKSKHMYVKVQVRNRLDLTARRALNGVQRHVS